MPRGIICPECLSDASVYYTRQVVGGTDRDYECLACNVLIDTEERVICVRHRDRSGVVPLRTERTLFDLVPSVELSAATSEN